MRPIKLLSISLCLLLAAFLSISPAAAQIKIGTNGATIAPASLLELESANQGLLLPRMADTVAINALNPPNGMLIYLTKAPAAGLYVRKVTGWEYLTGSLGGNGNFNSLTVAGSVTAVNFSGNLTGNATTATTATTATNSVNSAVTNDIVNPAITYPVFVNSTPGNQPLRTSSGNLSYVPATGILTARGFIGPLTGDVTGNATSSVDAQNTVNMRITDDLVTPTTMYPTFVSGTAGPLPPRVSSARLSFIPLTGELTASTFRGALLGNATSATSVTGNVAAVNGGTGQSIYTPGDMLYASTSTSLVKLPIGIAGNVLRVSAANLPAWSTAGAGTVINVSGTANRISVTDPTVSPVIDIASTYIGQNSITTLGTVSTGVWNGTPLTATYGGTGLNTLPLGRVLVGNGTGTVASVDGDVADLVLTSNGPGLAPTFKATGVGDMVLSVNQTVTGIKTFGGVGNVGKLVLAGNTTGFTTLNGPGTGIGGSVVLPQTGTLVTQDGTETLTNKTLTSPTLTSPSIGAATGTQLVLNNGSALTTTNQTGTGSIVMSIGPSISAATLTGTTSASDINATGTITAGSFSGTATNTLNVGTRTATTVVSGVDLANAAASPNTLNAIVKRDGSGNFTAGTITASLIGDVTGNISGNAASVTTNANLTGEATSVGNAVTLTNSAVIGKTLTAYTTGTGAVGAGDNILQAIGKVEGNSNLKAPINNPIFTGTVSIPSPFTLGITSVTSTGTQLNYLNLATGTIGSTSTNLVFSDSPSFTGTPTLPTGTIATTQTAGNNSTAIATTAFVTDADNLKANIASPALTGTPSAPTAAPGVNTTQIATTAFVSALGALKANVASPTFTGTVTTPAFVISTTSTPTSTADASGTVGEIRMDASYIYVKTAAGWKRIALSTW